MPKLTRTLSDHFYGGGIAALGTFTAMTSGIVGLATVAGLSNDWKIATVVAGATLISLPSSIGAYQRGSIGSAFLRAQDTPERSAVRALYLAHRKEKSSAPVARPI